MTTLIAQPDSAEALEALPKFDRPLTIDALFRGALYRDGEAAVQFAALVLYLHGQTSHPFGWEHRGLLVRFRTMDRGRRESAFAELCAIVAVDPQKYLRPRRVS